MNYDATHYYLYDEMTALLNFWASEYPDVLTVSSIGRSYQGREIPLVTLTLGRGKKPAVLIDGNIHSAEVISSCAVLYTIDKLLAQYRAGDSEILQILRDKILYLIPRINVDAVDVNLTTDEFCRGSLLPFHEAEDGVRRCDVDGDGVVHQMRRKNPEGSWYASKLDDMVMFRIWPGMPVPEDAVRYDFICEGLYQGDGEPEFREARSPYDIDPNRSFPFEWKRDAIGVTLRNAAGDYPLQDCETRALANFIQSHPEIMLNVNTHSNMGTYITPMDFTQHIERTEPILADEAVFDAIGEDGVKISGYKAKNVFPKEAVCPAPGSYTTWLYYMLGIPAWCAEIGPLKLLYTNKEEADTMYFMDELSTEEMVVEHRRRLVEWDRTKNGGAWYMPWHEFEHPQFGTIEIGGWANTNDTNCIWNLPGEYLARDCEDAYRFYLLNIRAAAQLKLLAFTAEDGHAAATIANIGRFPSTKTWLAHEKGFCSPGMVQIEGLHAGKATVLIREQLPVLAGGEAKALTWTLPEGGYENYRITIEGECAGEQILEA